MPDETPGRFVPMHDAHAIEQVLITVQFAQQLDNPTLQRLPAIFAAAHGAELPGARQLRMMGFTMGAGGLSPIAAGGNAEGFVRTRAAPSGTIEKELVVERSAVRYRTTAYTRWQDVWTEARGYFATVFAAIDANVTCASYSINFVDKFIWRGNPQEARPGLLIRADTPYVTRLALEGQDLWHSHTGAFLRGSERVKRLLAVDVDCIDEALTEGVARVVRVGSVITDNLDQPGYEASGIALSVGMDAIDAGLTGVHNLLKDVFRDVCTPEICASVGLDTP